MSTENNPDVLVIGAGMAGLIAAAALASAGRRVLVLDKGRGVGGRLASRRIDRATFDHGAQFLTARDPRFAATLEEAQRSGAAREWFRGASDAHVRWRGNPAMTSVAKHLASGLDLALQTPVSALRSGSNGWDAETADGKKISAAAVILTPPVPQSLALLDAGANVLPQEMRTRLAALEYERCLAVMAVLDRPSNVPPPGGFAPNDGPIAWIADNQIKGISAEPAVTIHATHAFSTEHWDLDRNESARKLLEAAGEWIGAEIQDFHVHGWRYSKPRRIDEQLCATVDRSLVLAGDAFGGPRVEGAALSGWAAAEAILTNR